MPGADRRIDRTEPRPPEERGVVRQGRQTAVARWPGAPTAAVVTRMRDDTITELLQALSSSGVDAAWREFQARYSPTIRRVIRRHEIDHDRVEQCYEYVCGALSDDAFRRLRSFRPDGPARFETWLMAVVSNLCVDWRRGTVGRLRPPKAVARLPELDRHVYHCLYERGMTRAMCLEVLAPRFPELDFPTVSAINARVFALLPSRQRWLLSTRAAARQPVRSSPTDGGCEGPAAGVADPAPLPDEVVSSLQERRRLQDALAKLPTDERLLLRLRYEQGLTLAEVARLAGRGDPFRAHRKIEAALVRLAELMTGAHAGETRKS